MTQDSSDLYHDMRQAMADKSLLNQARDYGYHYLDTIETRPVYPTKQAIDNLSIFDEAMPEQGIEAADILTMLQHYAMPATINQLCGRYYGFVNGGVLPISMAVKWLTTIWDQNAAIYHTSPANACIEDVVQAWLVDLFQLPPETVAGFVGGSSVAIFSALSAARYRLYHNIGWDINNQGMMGAPPLHILASEHIHGTVTKALCLLGFGKNNITWLPCDDQGRVCAEQLPPLHNNSLVILGAGNINSGAFDDFVAIGTLVEQAGGWLHIDGAFGLWARASHTLSHLTEGIEYGHSWSVDGHKTLNVPYDNGIVLCRDKEALVSALQAQGAYMLLDDTKRQGMYYTPEMSRRARAFELWAAFKYLGKHGIDNMVTNLHHYTCQLSHNIQALGYPIINDVVFNQIITKGDNDDHTDALIEYIQQTDRCWVGGSQWYGHKVMRISLCNWITNNDDIAEVTNIFADAIEKVS